MRESDLLCRVKRKKVKTTNSKHHFPRYPNLIKAKIISWVNQVWLADITYIRLPAEFVYLAAILDAHSRKVIGWNLSRRLDVSLSLTALECALAKRQIPPGVLEGRIEARGFDVAGTYLWCYRDGRAPDSTARDFDALGLADAQGRFRIPGLPVPGIHWMPLSSGIDSSESRCGSCPWPSRW